MLLFTASVDGHVELEVHCKLLKLPDVNATMHVPAETASDPEKPPGLTR
jgi:hypothetical protein